MTALGTFCGIDPGLSGGIALLSGEGIALAFQMPKTEGDIAQLFENRIRPAEVAFCLIEKVHAIPSERVINGKPVKGISSVASFTFGRNVGVLTGPPIGSQGSFSGDGQTHLAESPRHSSAH
jgi:hypothetical protein